MLIWQWTLAFYTTISRLFNVALVVLNLVFNPSDVWLWLKPIIGHLVLAAGQWLELISSGGIHHSRHIDPKGPQKITQTMSVFSLFKMSVAPYQQTRDISIYTQEILVQGIYKFLYPITVTFKEHKCIRNICCKVHDTGLCSCHL